MPSPISNVARLARVDVGQVLDQALEAGVVLALAGPEALQDVDAVLASAGDLVEDVLELGGEAVVDQPAEVLLHQADDAERDPGRHERRALLVDVAAVLDGADDRGVGGRPPDLALLQLLDEAGLGEAGRRLGLVAGRAELVDGDGVALRDVGQLGLLVVALLVGVVAGLDVRLEEAVERDRPARAGELDRSHRWSRRPRCAA